MADVDPIIVQITAEFGDLKKDLADVKRGINSVSDEAKETSKNTEKMGKSFAVSAVSLGLMVTAARKLVGVLPNLIISQLQASKETELWARRLSIATGKMQQLTAVGRRFGASTDDVGDAVKDLNERIADAARGNKTYEDALKMVGLASKELIKLPVEEQFIKVADAIGKMSNAGDRNFVTAELMADAGFRLIPMFEQGADAIHKMMVEVVRTNEALDSFEVAKLEEANQAIKNMENTMTSFANSITTSVVPAINTFSQIMEGWSNILGSTAEDEMAGFIKESTELEKKLASLQKSLKFARGGGYFGFFDTSKSDVQEYSAKIIDTVLALDTLDAKIKALATRDDPLLNNMKAFQNLPVFGPQPALGGAPSTAEADAIKIGLQAAADARQIFAANEIIAQAQQNALKEEQAAEYQATKLNREFEEMLAEGELKEQMRVAEEEAHKAWLDRMFGADQRAQEQNAKLWKAGWEGKMAVASDFMGQMSILMNTNSRKQFEIGKAAAIAQVAIDTPKAAMSAYSAMAGIPFIGPALGVAAAGAAIASGVSQMQNIKAQSFGGGGSVGGSAVDAGGSDVGGSAQAPQNVIDASFNIQGSSVSADSVRGMLGSLNELIEDGGTLRSVTVI